MSWLVLVVIAVIVVPAALWWLDLDWLRPRELLAADAARPALVAPLRAAPARGLVVRSRARDGREVGELRLTPDELVVTGAFGSTTRVARNAITAARRNGDALEIEWATDSLTCQVDDIDGWVRDLVPRSAG